MNSNLHHPFRNYTNALYFRAYRLLKLVERFWFPAIFCGALFYLFYHRNIQIRLSVQPGRAVEAVPASLEKSGQSVRQSVFSAGWNEGARDQKEGGRQRRQRTYIERYGPVAQKEMRLFGIPASVTLAQGLLESKAGESRLALENNNHFGIKCFSKTCKRGHCRNFEDDSHKDFFRVYGSPWESYRAHSTLLQSDRYQRLFNLDPYDYRSWAIGLQDSGYATDSEYGEKLIKLIEDLRLYRYDYLGE